MQSLLTVIMTQLASLDENKTTGPDNISTWMLKGAAQALSILLALVSKELIKEDLPSCQKSQMYQYI